MNQCCFPGYQQCSGCQQLISEKEVHEHLLECRGRNRECPFCQQRFAEEQFERHLLRCSEEEEEEDEEGETDNAFRPLHLNILSPLSNIDSTSDDDDDDDAFQTPTATTPSRSRSPVLPSSSVDQKNDSRRECLFCSTWIDSSVYLDHCLRCSSTSSSLHQCLFCSKEFPLSSTYHRHVEDCSLELPERSPMCKECPFCSASFVEDLFVSHLSSCSSPISEQKSCLLCSSLIDANVYETHLLSCCNDEKVSSPVSCFTCSRRILFSEVSCGFGHCHCSECFLRTMKDFLQRGQTPLCHRDKCHYEYSRSTFFTLPIPRHLFNRLLPLVRSEERLHCSKCRFYYSLDDEHEDHQCHFPSSPLSREEMLVDLLPRTRFPFSAEQLDLYLRRHPSNNPLKVVEDLSPFGSVFPYELVRRECSICLEECRYEEIFVFDCPSLHKCCSKCFLQSCRTKINEEQILTCVLCQHLLNDGDLNQLPRLDQQQLKQIKDYQLTKTFDLYSRRTRTILKCPRANCSWIAELQDPNERFRVVCQLCQYQFCSLCNQQYHYRTQCQQIIQITQQWFTWCQTGRQRYQQVREEDEANEQRTRDLQRRYEELMQDEEYKSNNCRLCPSCQRLVQRLEGCDAMICGQDAHGGNLQSGCGQRFNWTEAQPYQSSTTTFQVQELPQRDRSRPHHQGIRCDHCSEQVNGIRFDCVHCPALTFCELCEQQATLQHSQQHLFRLIRDPQQELFSSFHIQ